MIRVNLLPQEYRKAEATPLKQFFATAGAAVVAALAIVAWVTVRFGVLESKRQDLENVKGTVKSQEEQVKAAKDLAAWLGEYKNQYDKIDKVTESRLVWSRKMDEFWEIVVSPKVPGRYEVWLKTLGCKVQNTQKVGGDIQFAGVSAGPQMFKMSDFHEDLKTSDMYKEFADITYPYGTREPLPGQNREPTEGWTFNFTMLIKPFKELNEMRAKAALEAAGKK